MIESERGKEVWGVSALFAAAFLEGALFAGVATAGERCWSAHATFGPVGACARAGMYRLVGPVAATLIPLLIVLIALRALARITASQERRWRMAGAGLITIVAIAAAIARNAIPWSAAPHPRVDILGGSLAWAMLRAFGTTGTWIVLALSLCTLAIATIAWEPFRRMVAGSAHDANQPPARPRPGDAEASRRQGAPVRRVSVPRPAIAARPRVVATQLDLTLELPPHDLLGPDSAPAATPESSVLDVLGYRLVGALRALKIDAQIVGRVSGAAVTRFEVGVAPGVKLRELEELSGEIAAAMKVTRARVVAPIPGRGTVGVEVPNPSTEIVRLRGLLDSRDYQAAPTILPLAIGRDLEGRPIVADLAKMPHLLLAGGPQSGKSTALDGCIASLVYRHSSRTLRFLMVDHSRGGLDRWEGLPHQRGPVVSDVAEAAEHIEELALEMEARSRTLIASGSRNIREFNQRSPAAALAYIVIVINELADLMLSEEGVEASLAMLALRGRSTGIHVIMATEKANASVVTPLIKGNFPSRLAFQLESAMDSRRVLDATGAEALIGKGDMLFVAPGKSHPVRLQGGHLAADEVARIVDWFGAKVHANA
jgi:DNA segregation ATPase FtsK/SpoIIIE, S-DNA-T family